MYKDDPKLNQRSKLTDNIVEIADRLRRAKSSRDPEAALKKWLFDEEDDAAGLNGFGQHNPCHKQCDGFDTKRVTEKRICHCMFYFNSGLPKECKNCKLPFKWRYTSEEWITDRVRITEFEYPTQHVIKGMGGIDLVFDEKYGVEVKPPMKSSKETLARMFAEILTYTLDAVNPAAKNHRYLPAICFFENEIDIDRSGHVSVSRKETEQMKEYGELIHSGDVHVRKAMQYLRSQVKVFYFKTVYDSIHKIMCFNIIPI